MGGVEDGVCPFRELPSKQKVPGAVVTRTNDKRTANAGFRMITLSGVRFREGPLSGPMVTDLGSGVSINLAATRGSGTDRVPRMDRSAPT